MNIAPSTVYWVGRCDRMAGACGPLSKTKARRRDEGVQRL